MDSSPVLQVDHIFAGAGRQIWAVRYTPIGESIVPEDLRETTATTPRKARCPPRHESMLARDFLVVSGLHEG